MFWNAEATVDEPSAFQLSLATPKHISLSSLTFSSLSIYFSTSTHPFVIRHSAGDVPNVGNHALRKVDLGAIPAELATDVHEKAADLRWGRGSTIVFAGTIASDVPTTITVCFTFLDTEYLFDGSLNSDIKSSADTPRR